MKQKNLAPLAVTAVFAVVKRIIPTMPPHLFVDISSHGLGHLAQAAPILNELGKRLPELRLTVRSGLPEAKLRERLHARFTHLAGRSDFGFIMHDAVSIDLAASAAAYREQHDDWELRVAAEAELLATLAPDLVLSDAAYLPLAGAAQAGIASLSMCSLNWAELFAHFFGNEDWATPIHQQMLAAYRSAECFLRLTPAMAMADLPRRRAIAPVAALGRRVALHERLGCAPADRIVLVAFGGFDTDCWWPNTLLVTSASASPPSGRGANRSPDASGALRFVGFCASTDWGGATCPSASHHPGLTGIDGR